MDAKSGHEITAYLIDLLDFLKNQADSQTALLSNVDT